MIAEQLAGLPVKEALVLLEQAGVNPEIVISDPPRHSFSSKGRELRVVRYADGMLLCSWFRVTLTEAAHD